MPNESEDINLPTRQVADRYKVHPRTVDRWARDPALGFPKAFDINGRWYRTLRSLREFDQRQASKSDSVVRHGAAKASAQRREPAVA
jgi:hypothetical protein